MRKTCLAQEEQLKIVFSASAIQKIIASGLGIPRLNLSLTQMHFSETDCHVYCIEVKLFWQWLVYSNARLKCRSLCCGVSSSWCYSDKEICKRVVLDVNNDKTKKMLFELRGSIDDAQEYLAEEDACDD